MDREFLAALVCPKCLEALQYDDTRRQLICEKDKLAYPIDDNIPVLLESAALPLEVEEMA